MLLPGVMGGVGFPGRGELGYPGIDRPGPLMAAWL